MAQQCHLRLHRSALGWRHRSAHLEGAVSFLISPPGSVSVLRWSHADDTLAGLTDAAFVEIRGKGIARRIVDGKRHILRIRLQHFGQSIEVEVRVGNDLRITFVALSHKTLRKYNYILELFV